MDLQYFTNKALVGSADKACKIHAYMQPNSFEIHEKFRRFVWKNPTKNVCSLENLTRNACKMDNFEKKDTNFFQVYRNICGLTKVPCIFN